MKPIKISEELIEKAVEELRNKLTKGGVVCGNEVSVRLPQPPSQGSKTATVIFSEKAAAKMTALVNHFSTEVGWMGTAYKDDVGVYVVDDIVVYPQHVTGAKVDTDAVEIAKWSDSLDDDVWDTLRFQGHSHVNMWCSPSGTDSGDQERYLDWINGEGFFIFAILNKRDESWFTIYDFDDNVVYEDNDITYEIDGDDMSAFLEMADKLVQKKDVSLSYPRHSNDLVNRYFEDEMYTDDDYITYVTEQYYKEKKDDE